MYRGREFEMITISADELETKDKALEVLKEKHVSSRNVLFNSDDRDALFDGLDSEWKGGLPYTVLIAPGGEVVYRKHDTIDPLELKRKIADCVGRTYAKREAKKDAAEKAKKEAKKTSASKIKAGENFKKANLCLLYTSPSPRDRTRSRMPSSA